MEGTQSQRRKSATKQPTTATFASIVGVNAAPPKKSLEWLVGRRIKLKTALDEEIEGLIYTYDRKLNCIALGSRHARKGLSFRVIKISHIKDIVSIASDEVMTPLQDPAVVADTSKLQSYLPVKPIHVDALRHRESNSLRVIKQQEAKIGVGVTGEAQAIFDALAKTLPCRWSDKTIIVMDEVRISPPYDVNSCEANVPSGASLDRVKKVLEGERKRLTNSKK